jgi:Outer membrane receptor proteins, mostly Fe transport
MSGKHLLLLGIAILSFPKPSMAQGDDDVQLTLRESTVSAQFSSQGKSPLRLSTIDSDRLRDMAGARTYPELLRNVPGVYATSESGSYGDAKLNIRGFRQENISVLLNGIPISGLTSGSMYWNNWMGLADATYAIQVQKGVGSSMLSDGSVGGSVNILTKTTSERSSIDFATSMSHFGTSKTCFNWNSGELGNGWGASLMASYVGGSGYVDCTDVDSFAYMLNVSKRFDGRNTLLFTALGSPEKHEQRSSKLSSEEVAQHGLSYSKNWGYRDGKPFNISKNEYFKPYFTLQHIHESERLSMKNSLYLAIGNGGGRWSETAGKPISAYSKDGQIDWDAACEANLIWTGSDLNGQRAQNVLSNYLAGHTQAGAILSVEYAVAPGWKFGGGVHYQYYATWEKEQIVDLLGADYWFEDYEHKSLAGVAGRNPVKKEGDFIRTNNGKNIHHGTAYVVAEYDSDRLHANAGASFFGVLCRRWDRYNYVEDSSDPSGREVRSDLASGSGASLKGGALFSLSPRHSVYVNGGWYSRLPYSSAWFSSGNNEITKDVSNEMNILSEAGYRFVYDRGGVEATVYAVWWKNKTLMSNAYKQLDAGDIRYMITGLDAFHTGIEFEAWHRFTDWMKLTTFASIGDWRWKNDVSASVYDDYNGAEIQKINVYADGLPVGDAPQTQIGAVAETSIPGGWRFNLNWSFSDRMYADFDPATRTNPDDRACSYRIPSCNLVGAYVGWTHSLAGRGTVLTLFATGSNLLNTSYIERGKDGSDHTLASFRGFWGFGRTATIGVSLCF